MKTADHLTGTPKQIERAEFFRAKLIPIAEAFLANKLDATFDGPVIAKLESVMANDSADFWAGGQVGNVIGGRADMWSLVMPL